jgi:phage terminase Nu1 subunit (DNA packaging protein)
MQVKQHELAELFGVTSRTLRDWHSKGLADVRDGQTGSYDLPAAIAWLVDREDDRSALVDEYREARARNQLAQALLREDELRVKRGELVPVDDVLGLVRTPLERVDAQLRTAPRRLSKAWSERLGTSHREALALIRELVEEVRGELREVFE